MDWTIIIVALITAAPPTMMAYVAWRESKKLHTVVNSRMDELLSSEKKVSKSEGREEMREENITTNKQ